MKQFFKAAACLALLLVCMVGNASANVLWSTGGTDQWYVDKGSAASLTSPSEWYTGTISVNPALQGTTGPLKLELDLSVKGNWNNSMSNFQLFLVGGTNTNVPLSLVALPTIYNSGPETHLASPLVTEVTLNPMGIYSFYAYAFGLSQDAQWKLNGAKLTNAATPIPGAAILLGSGLLGLFGVNRARRQNS